MKRDVRKTNRADQSPVGGARSTGGNGAQKQAREDIGITMVIDSCCCVPAGLVPVAVAILTREAFSQLSLGERVIKWQLWETAGVRR